MTEQVAEPKKKRATADERKAALAAQIKAIEAKLEAKEKKLLEDLAKRAEACSKRRPQQPTIGQAATLLSQAAAAIKS